MPSSPDKKKKKKKAPAKRKIVNSMKRKETKRRKINKPPTSKRRKETQKRRINEPSASKKPVRLEEDSEPPMAAIARLPDPHPLSNAGRVMQLLDGNTEADLKDSRVIISTKIPKGVVLIGNGPK